MPETRLAVNAHIHLPPNFSAFETVEQAVALADEQDVRVLGASNYYDYGVYAQMAVACSAHGIAPLFGTEILCMIDELRVAGIKINDPGNPGRMYLCGKGISRFLPMSRRGTELIETIRRNDSDRMAAMVTRLSTIFQDSGIDVALDAAAVKQTVVARHGSAIETVYLQERHAAQAFQEALFERTQPTERAEILERLFGCPSKHCAEDSVGIQNEIRSHLMKSGKPAFVPETFVDFNHAFSLILELGGIPCYPTLVDGASPMCAYEQDVDDLIRKTRQRNIHCFELIPIRNSPTEVERYVTAMRNAGMIVTAGTEHNTRELIPMAPTCVGGMPIPESVQQIFWEGACVVAAHQMLVGDGALGYVDGGGNLAGNYVSQDDRISALAAVGAETILDAVEKRGRAAV